MNNILQLSLAEDGCPLLNGTRLPGIIGYNLDAIDGANKPATLTIKMLVLPPSRAAAPPPVPQPVPDPKPASLPTPAPAEAEEVTDPE